MKQYYLFCGLTILMFSAVGMQQIQHPDSQVDEKQAAARALEVPMSNAPIPCTQLLANNQILQTFLSEHSCEQEMKFIGLYNSFNKEYKAKVRGRDHEGQVILRYEVSYDHANKRIVLFDTVQQRVIDSAQEHEHPFITINQEIPNPLYRLNHVYGLGKIYIIDPVTDRWLYSLSYHHAIPGLEQLFPETFTTVDFEGTTRFWDMRFLKTSLTREQVALLEGLIQAKGLLCAPDADHLYASLPACWKEALERAYKPTLFARVWSWMKSRTATFTTSVVEF